MPSAKKRHLCKISTAIISMTILLPLASSADHGTQSQRDHDHSHSHSHNHYHTTSNEKAVQASKGVFDDKDVKARSLTDYEGDWQSLYPFLTEGMLDKALEAKAKKEGKTFVEIKDYYQIGYETNVDRITIDEGKISFFIGEEKMVCDYESAGFKILTYASGKKGVRYLFTCSEQNNTAPRYVQFSDHIIEPTKSSHFHIYMGNESHEALFAELTNWPTYYPKELTAEEISNDLVH